MKIVLIIFLLASIVANAQIRSFPKETIEELGKAIYSQDIKAAKATDVLFASRIDPVKEKLRGWVVEEKDGTTIVRFVRDNGKLEAFYDVIFKGDNAPELLEPKDRNLTNDQLALYKARTLGAKNIKRQVTNRYNIVTLKDPEKDAFLVYLLAATTDPNAVMIGGHYRCTISSDGEKLLDCDELFKSPLVLSKKPKELPEGAKLGALTMTTLVSDMPLETHVFQSLSHGMTFFVGTRNKEVWKVENGTIKKVKP